MNKQRGFLLIGSALTIILSLSFAILPGPVRADLPPPPPPPTPTPPPFDTPPGSPIPPPATFATPWPLGRKGDLLATSPPFDLPEVDGQLRIVTVPLSPRLMQ